MPFPLFPCPFRALAKLANVLEPVGLREEAEPPGQILAEFVMVCSRWQLVFHKAWDGCWVLLLGYWAALMVSRLVGLGTMG